jgi:hypothetical protein
LPAHLKSQISRELDRIELLLNQLKIVEAERDVLIEPASDIAPTPAVMLAELKGIGPQIAAMLWSEALYRHFDNRRQVAAYAGLVPTPCLDSLSPAPGDSEVINQVERLSSSETKIAPRSVRMAVWSCGRCWCIGEPPASGWYRRFTLLVAERSATPPHGIFS